MDWKPPRTRGLIAGLGIIIGILLVDVLLAVWITRKPVNLLSFALGLLITLSLLALALVAYWLYSLVSMRYIVNRNGLVITCGATKQIIPMTSIQQLIPGAGRALEGRMQGIHWPGFWLGHGHLAGLGLTLFYATVPLEEQILVVTPTLTYAISPADKEAFTQAFEARRQLGPLKLWNQESQPARFATWNIWSDRPAHILLGLGLLLAAALFAYLCWRYPGLPATVPLHFDTTGAVDRSGARRSLFVLPVIGLLIWGANGVLGLILRSRERVAAYLLWGGTLLAQVLLGLALSTLMR